MASRQYFANQESKLSSHVLLMLVTNTGSFRGLTASQAYMLELTGMAKGHSVGRARSVLYILISTV